MDSKIIADKNDKFRKEFDPAACKIHLTCGVAHANNVKNIVEAVIRFEDFNQDNDPYGEHDMAFFKVDGEKYFFKFDYYDDNYEYFKEDGNRVLTIGLANEY